jgi:hypothetical protein
MVSSCSGTRNEQTSEGTVLPITQLLKSKLELEALMRTEACQKLEEQFVLDLHFSRCRLTLVITN